jgi:hypothetical protein
LIMEFGGFQFSVVLVTLCFSESNKQSWRQQPGAMSVSFNACCLTRPARLIRFTPFDYLPDNHLPDASANVQTLLDRVQDLQEATNNADVNRRAAADLIAVAYLESLGDLACKAPLQDNPQSRG